MIFAYDNLRRFLVHCQLQGPVFRLEDYDGRSGVILRHDVDFELEPALRMAEVEAEQGVQGTYFILLTADSYNVLSLHGRAALRALVSTGAEVGVHFDPLIYGSLDGDELLDPLNREGNLLSDCIGRQVHSVSLHNPSLYNRYPIFEGWINAYAPDIFGPDRYISDSRMIFWHDPFALVARAKSQCVQICLHPEHYSPDGASYPQPQARFVRRFVDRFHEAFLINSSYAEAVDDETLMKIVCHS